MPKYEFTDNEVNVLKEMINIAVKAVGLDACQPGLFFKNKLDNPIKEETKKDGTTGEV